MKRVSTKPCLDIPIDSVRKQIEDYIERYKIHNLRIDMGGNKGIHKLGYE